MQHLIAACTIACSVMVTSGSALADDAADRPNILWLIAEDMSPELGCAGTPEVHTPNLDRLASEGIRYTNAFATSPVCSTSRSALMTGMHAVSIGAHNHRSHRDDGYALPAGVRLLTECLREAGYFTANVRRLDGGGDDDGPGWRGTGKTDWNFHVDGRPFDTNRWSDLRSHQPFFAQINFPETHRGRAWNTALERIETPADPAFVELPPYYPDHALTRQDWAQYLNAVMALDRKIGKVLERLERDGLADRTIVVFFADHGRAMVRAKQWCYDSGLRVPLIIRWPDANSPCAGSDAGTVDDQLISLIDITATTLKLAGVRRPDGMQGRVFLGDRRDDPRRYVFGTRDRCDETVFRIRTVRDERYRYIRNYMPGRPFLQLNRYKERTYPVLALMRQLHAEGRLTPVQAVLLAPHRPLEELYDTIHDPHETENLAGAPEHAEALHRLRLTLLEWIESVDDQGRVPEPPAVVEAWDRVMSKRYDRRTREEGAQ